MLERLVRRADIVIDCGRAADVEPRLALYRDIQATRPGLIICTITPFGLDGPYCDLTMIDLTQLAMGGVMASCGYDPGPDGVYDTPPIAPDMWQASHIACEHAVLTLAAALNFRELTGEGDCIDVSIHEAVSTCTEVALPCYIYNRDLLQRQTGRHAATATTPAWLRRTKDSRYVKAFLFWGSRDARVIAEMLSEAGIEHNLDTAAYRQLSERSPGEANKQLSTQVDRLVASMTAEEVYHKAQAKGLLWASVRSPEENLDDLHFQARGTFQAIHQPQIGRELYFPVSAATDGHDRMTDFKRGAPFLGQHTREVLSGLGFDEAGLDRLAAQGVI